MLRILFILFLIRGNVEAFGDSPHPSIAVIFDPGNPDASVGIVGQELLELGTLYENFEVIGFERQAIVVKELESQDAMQWPEGGEMEPKILFRARRLFMAKQMKAIYEAQLHYRDQFGDHFAPDLETLLNQGLLCNGFSAKGGEPGAQKQNYRFYIAATGETPRLALLPREPTFFAVAEPLKPEEDPAYFSVDQLGQIRFASTLKALGWGPVWDYADRSGGPRSRVVSYEA